MSRVTKSHGKILRTGEEWLPGAGEPLNGLIWAQGPQIATLARRVQSQ